MFCMLATMLTIIDGSMMHLIISWGSREACVSAWNKRQKHRTIKQTEDKKIQGINSFSSDAEYKNIKFDKRS